MKYILQILDLKLIDVDNNTCKTVFYPQEGETFLKERRKIYIVYHEKEVLYVGEANTSIKTRFQRSCTSYNHYITTGKARGGYKGYKWLNKTDNPVRNLKVAVATFNINYDDKRAFIEAIEGELVYLIRNKFGYWPKFQNEIHFSNCEGAGEIAEGMLNKTFCKS